MAGPDRSDSHSMTVSCAITTARFARARMRDGVVDISLTRKTI